MYDVDVLPSAQSIIPPSYLKERIVVCKYQQNHSIYKLFSIQLKKLTPSEIFSYAFGAAILVAMPVFEGPEL